MSSPSHVADTPITDRDQLVAVLASGEKPKSDWRIGTEHEKFGFRLDDLMPPTFDGERGIEALLTGLTRFGWDAGERVTGSPHHRAVEGQRLGDAGTRGPARTLRRAARQHPPDLRRSRQNT
jgi:hypothetical protein